MSLSLFARLSLWTLLTSFLTGCYCVSVPSSAHPRNLRPAQGYSICMGHGGDGKSMEATVYYGVPQMDRADIEARYDVPSISTIEYGNFNQFGVRGEYYVNSPLFGFKVLGLGLDYSVDRFSVRSILTGNAPDSLDRYARNRLMLSVNHMTWVRPKMIGYLIAQGGVQQTFLRSEILSSGGGVTKSKLPLAFDYRFGYGFQFFLNGPWGINVEGGYGGGAYGKAGLFLWF